MKKSSSVKLFVNQMIFWAYVVLSSYYFISSLPMHILQTWYSFLICMQRIYCFSSVSTCIFMSLGGVKGLDSISHKMSYCKISWSFEAAKLVVQIIVSLWNLTGTSAAACQISERMYNSKYKSRGFRDFVSSCNKTWDIETEPWHWCLFWYI